MATAPVIVNADWTSWEAGTPVTWEGKQYTIGVDAFASIYDPITLSGQDPIPGAAYGSPDDGRIIYVTYGNFAESKSSTDPFVADGSAWYTLDFSSAANDVTSFVGSFESTARNGVGFRVSSGNVVFGEEPVLNENEQIANRTTITLNRNFYYGDKNFGTDNEPDLVAYPGCWENSDFVVGGAPMNGPVSAVTATVYNTDLSAYGWIWVGSGYVPGEVETFVADNAGKNQLIVENSALSSMTLQVRYTGYLEGKDSTFDFWDMHLRGNATFDNSDLTGSDADDSRDESFPAPVTAADPSDVYGENNSTATLTLKNGSTLTTVRKFKIGKADSDDDVARKGVVDLQASSIGYAVKNNDGEITDIVRSGEIALNQNGTLTMDAASQIYATSFTNAGTLNIAIDGSKADVIEIAGGLEAPAVPTPVEDPGDFTLAEPQAPSKAYYGYPQQGDLSDEAYNDAVDAWWESDAGGIAWEAAYEQWETVDHPAWVSAQNAHATAADAFNTYTTVTLPNYEAALTAYNNALNAATFTNTGTIAITVSDSMSDGVLRVIKANNTTDIAEGQGITVTGASGYRIHKGFLAVYKGLDTTTLFVSHDAAVDPDTNYAAAVTVEAKTFYVDFTAFNDTVKAMESGYSDTSKLLFDGRDAQKLAYVGVTNNAISGLTFGKIGTNAVDPQAEEKDVTVTLTQLPGTDVNTYRFANGFTVDEGVTFSADKMYQTRLLPTDPTPATVINGTLVMRQFDTGVADNPETLDVDEAHTPDIFLVSSGSVVVNGTLTGPGSIALKTTEAAGVTLTVNESATVDNLGILDLGANAEAIIWSDDVIINEINMRPVYAGQVKPTLTLEKGADVTVTGKLSSDAGILNMDLNSVLQVKTPEATIAGGTINLTVKSADLTNEFYKLVYGKLGNDVTVNCKVDGVIVGPTTAQSGKINDQYSYTSLNGKGLFVMKTTLMDTLYVDNQWVAGEEGYTFGDPILDPASVVGKGYFDVNAFQQIAGTNDVNGITVKGDAAGQGGNPFAAKNIVLFDGTYAGNSKDFYYTNNVDVKDAEGKVTTAAVTISAGGLPLDPAAAADPQPVATNTVIFNSSRFYLSHAFSTAIEESGTGAEYTNNYQAVIDAEIAAGKVPTYRIAEGLTFKVGENGTGRLNIGNAMGKGGTSESKTYGIANLIVDGTVKGTFYLTPYAKMDVSKTGTVTFGNSNDTMNFKPGSELTVTGIGKDAAYAAGNGYQFYQSALNFIDGGTATFTDTSVKLHWLWNDHASDNALAIKDSEITFKNSKLDIDSSTGYTQAQFFVNIDATDANTMTVNFDGSDVKFLQPTAPVQRRFDPVAGITVNFTNSSTFEGTVIANGGTINVTNSTITVKDSVAHYTNTYPEPQGEVEVNLPIPSSFTNQATLNLNNGAVIESDITNCKAGDVFYVENAGTSSASQVYATSAGTINLDGTVKVGVTEDDKFTAATITNNGTVNVAETATATLSGVIANSGTIQVDGKLTLANEGLADGENNITNNGTIKVYGTLTGGKIFTDAVSGKVVSVYGTASLSSFIVGNNAEKTGVRFYGVTGQTDAAEFDLANVKKATVQILDSGIVNLSQGSGADTTIGLKVGSSTKGTATITSNVSIASLGINHPSATLNVAAGKTLTVTYAVSNEGTINLKDGSTLAAAVTNKKNLVIEATTGENVTKVTKAFTNNAACTATINGKAKFTDTVTNSGTINVNATTEFAKGVANANGTVVMTVGSEAISGSKAVDDTTSATIVGGNVKLDADVTFDWGYAGVTGDNGSGITVLSKSTKLYGGNVIVNAGKTVTLSDTTTLADNTLTTEQQAAALALVGANKSNSLTVNGTANLGTSLTVTNLDITSTGKLNMAMDKVLTVGVAGTETPGTFTAAADSITITIPDDWYKTVESKKLLIDGTYSNLTADTAEAFYATVVKDYEYAGYFTVEGKNLYLDPSKIVKVSGSWEGGEGVNGWYKVVANAVRSDNAGVIYVLDGDFSKTGTNTAAYLNNKTTEFVGTAGKTIKFSKFVAGGYNVSDSIDNHQGDGLTVANLGPVKLVTTAEASSNVTIKVGSFSNNIVGGDVFTKPANTQSYNSDVTHFYRVGKTVVDTETQTTTTTATNLVITGGSFVSAAENYIVGGIYYYGEPGNDEIGGKAVRDASFGLATIIGDVNTTIVGGSFTGYSVYGGNAGTHKSLGKNTYIEGDVNVTLKDVTFAGDKGGNIFAGNYGAGTITGDVTVDLQGEVEFTKLYGGNTGDIRSSTGVLLSTIEGNRVLTLTGFSGELDFGKVSAFNTVKIDGDSVVTIKSDDTAATKQANLDVVNWDIDLTGVTNDFAFDFNSYIKDTIEYKDSLALSGFDSIDFDVVTHEAVIFSDVSNFNKLGAVSLAGEVAVLDEGVWATDFYSLSADSDGNMILTQVLA